jgi:type IV pilus assembly protein PilQ
MKIPVLLLALILFLNVGSAENWTGERASFDFKDIDIRDLFRFFADLSGMNLILHPGVKGTITLKLTDVPWDQALDLITKNHGLGYTIEGNVIWIASLDVISQEAKKRAEGEKQRILALPLETRIVPLSYAKATDMERIVRRLLTPKGTVIVDPRTNTLIITDVVLK